MEDFKAMNEHSYYLHIIMLYTDGKSDNENSSSSTYQQRQRCLTK